MLRSFIRSRLLDRVYKIPEAESYKPFGAVGQCTCGVPGKIIGYLLSPIIAGIGFVMFLWSVLMAVWVFRAAFGNRGN